MYGIYGKITPEKKKWPSERASALCRIVLDNRNSSGQTSSIFRCPADLCAALEKAKIPLVDIKRIELALTSKALENILTSGEKNPSSMEINNVLLSMEKCGLAESEACDLLEDLLYAVGIDPVPMNAAALKKTVSEEKMTKYIPPHVYRSRLKEIMGYVSEQNTNELTDEVMEDLHMFAECNIGEANYILALMYQSGLGVKKDTGLANQYAKKAAVHGYPPAYAALGDAAYEDNNYDEAYAYYSKPGAIVLDKKRCQRVDRIFKAKKFANKVCVFLGILYAVILSAMIFGINRLSLSGAHPVILTVFISLMTLTMIAVLYVHHVKPF